jgi:L-lactate dehydrogenase complex protein LldF
VRANIRHATETIRAKRGAVVAEVPDWQLLRSAGAAIKDEALHRLDEVLVELESSVQAAGGTVHWARDAAEANETVTALVQAEGVAEVVKVKSLATDEIRLNEALEGAGIRPLETDLAELIIQLAGERPSHLLVPAITGQGRIRDLAASASGCQPLGRRAARGGSTAAPARGVPRAVASRARTSRPPTSKNLASSSRRARPYVHDAARC